MTRLSLAAATASVLVLLSACWLPLLGRQALPVGETAPAIDVTFRDEAHTLAQLDGQPVLITFWSST